MNSLINSKYIHLLWWIFAPLLVSKLFLSFGAFFWTTNVFESLKKKEIDSLRIYEFPKFYEKDNLKVNRIKRNSSKLKNTHLKACYVGVNKKFIIVEENKKTFFIKINEKYKGAKLIEVNVNSAIFDQYGMQTTLSFKKIKLRQNTIKIYKNKIENEKYISIRKEDFIKYLKNTKELLKDIKIKEIIQNKSFKGLEIVFLRKGSLFDTMRLKKGDILKTIDDKKITSTISLMPHYSNLSNSSALKIGIQRDGKMKEIVYEIN